jgi:hypothetical protein
MQQSRDNNPQSPCPFFDQLIQDENALGRKGKKSKKRRGSKDRGKKYDKSRPSQSNISVIKTVTSKKPRKKKGKNGSKPGSKRTSQRTSRRGSGLSQRFGKDPEKDATEGNKEGFAPPGIKKRDFKKPLSFGSLKEGKSSDDTYSN